MARQAHGVMVPFPINLWTQPPRVHHRYHRPSEERVDLLRCQFGVGVQRPNHGGTVRVMLLFHWIPGFDPRQHQNLQRRNNVLCMRQTCTPENSVSWETPKSQKHNHSLHEYKLDVVTCMCLVVGLNTQVPATAAMAEALPHTEQNSTQ